MSDEHDGYPIREQIEFQRGDTQIIAYRWPDENWAGATARLTFREGYNDVVVLSLTSTGSNPGITFNIDYNGNAEQGWIVATILPDLSKNLPISTVKGDLEITQNGVVTTLIAWEGNVKEDQSR